MIATLQQVDMSFTNYRIENCFMKKLKRVYLLTRHDSLLQNENCTVHLDYQLQCWYDSINTRDKNTCAQYLG